MKQLERLLAEKLLQISAVKLQPAIPFTWRSGWRSPIYNDHRRALSYPKIRNFIKTELARIVLERFPDVDAIASVSTGAIAIGALAADCIGASFVYIRSTPKDHGLENSIEGNLVPKQKVVVVEDVVTTGANAIKAIETVKAAGCEVLGAVTIFSFEFHKALAAFGDLDIPLVAMTNYHDLVDVACEIGFIREDEVKVLRQWHNDPANWIPAKLR